MTACTIGGTLDNIPKQKPMVVETVHPQASRSACVDRDEQLGHCPRDRVSCAFDDQGCDVCICQ